MRPRALLLERSLLDGYSPAPSMANGLTLRTPSLKVFRGLLLLPQALLLERSLLNGGGAD
jgi:hypothetical protein